MYWIYFFCLLSALSLRSQSFFAMEKREDQAGKELYSSKVTNQSNNTKLEEKYFPELDELVLAKIFVEAFLSLVSKRWRNLVKDPYVTKKVAKRIQSKLSKKISMYQGGCSGNTDLHCAACRGDIGVISFLVKVVGADVNVQNDHEYIFIDGVEQQQTLLLRPAPGPSPILFQETPLSRPPFFA